MEQQKLKVGDVVRFKGKNEVYRIIDAVAVQTEDGTVYDYTLKDCHNIPTRQLGGANLEKVEPDTNVAEEKKEPPVEHVTEAKSVYNIKKNKKKKK